MGTNNNTYGSLSFEVTNLIQQINNCVTELLCYFHIYPGSNILLLRINICKLFARNYVTFKLDVIICGAQMICMSDYFRTPSSTAAYKCMETVFWEHYWALSMKGMKTSLFIRVFQYIFGNKYLWDKYFTRC